MTDSNKNGRSLQKELLQKVFANQIEWCCGISKSQFIMAFTVCYSCCGIEFITMVSHYDLARFALKE